MKIDSEIYSFEKGWWWDCLSTYTEETKQFSYAEKMNLNLWNFGPGPVHDLEGKSVLDIGGGPVSLLLKTIHRGKCTVVDPILYPSWTIERYREGNINFIQSEGETFIDHQDFKNIIYDEVWIYNVLQHTLDPELIIKNARKVGKLIRIFEWINIPAHIGHPQELKEHLLNEWLDGKGTVEYLEDTEKNLFGDSYYGVFEYE